MNQKELEFLAGNRDVAKMVASLIEFLAKMKREKQWGEVSLTCTLQNGELKNFKRHLTNIHKLP